MQILEPLNVHNFFCPCKRTTADSCLVCTPPVAEEQEEQPEPETYLNSWTAADVRWAIFAVAALVFFTWIGVTQ